MSAPNVFGVVLLRRQLFRVSVFQHFVYPSFKMNLVLGTTALCLAFATSVLAADFDGDGIADEFIVTRDAAKASKEAGIVLVNPWKKKNSSLNTQPSTLNGTLGFIVRLSRGAKRYRLCDPEFLGSPAWKEQKPPVETITRTDKRYREWKKEVPALKGDAIQLGTEAGIDILLYWDGKQWRLFWPKRSPEARA